MAFDLKSELVEFSIIIEPGRRRTVWISYPGFPPLMYQSDPWAPVTRISGNDYDIEALCWLLALERLPRLYEAMSGHERLAVHAAEERAHRAAPLRRRGRNPP